MARKRIGEILIKAGVLDATGLHAALREQQRWGGYIGRILVDMKLINEDVLVRALSHQLNLPSVDLEKYTIPPNVLDLVPGELAEQLGILPFNVENKFLDVAMSDPTNLGISDELRIRTRYTVRPYLAGPKAIEKALAVHYHRGPALTQYLTKMHLRQGQTHEEGLTADSTASGIPVHDVKPVIESTSAQQAQVAGSRTSQQAADERDAEILALQQRISELESLVSRDEDVLRKILGLLVEKGVATREEILERIK